MQFKVNFIFSNENIDPFLKEILKMEFAERRGVFVNYVNEKYEKWNEEFHELHPELDGYSEEYNTFIRNKQKPYIDKANAVPILANLIRLTNDNEIADIRGYSEMLKTEIELTLTEMKES